MFDMQRRSFRNRSLMTANPWKPRWPLKAHWVKVLHKCSVCLQSNLKEALLSCRVEYRRTYLAALAAVMGTDGDSASLPQHLEEPVLPECLDLLLGDLEDERGGPEFLSQALHVASLLLSQWPDSRSDTFYCLACTHWSTPCLQRWLSFVWTSPKISVVQRWCSVLERQRSPDAPEVLRMACAEALCVAGVTLMRERHTAVKSRYEGTPNE